MQKIEWPSEEARKTALSLRKAAQYKRWKARIDADPVERRKWLRRCKAAHARLLLRYAVNAERKRADFKKAYARIKRKRLQNPAYLAFKAERQRRRDDPEYDKLCRYLAHIKKKFAGVFTGEEYLRLLNFQHGVCSICSAPFAGGRRRLHTDHDHATNTVRGLLCDQCNHGLGSFRDRPDFLRRAALYLEKPPALEMKLSVPPSIQSFKRLRAA